MEHLLRFFSTVIVLFTLNPIEGKTKLRLTFGTDIFPPGSKWMLRIMLSRDEFIGLDSGTLGYTDAEE